jgi:hypothetical protein
MAESLTPIVSAVDVAEYLLVEHGGMPTAKLNALICVSPATRFSRYENPLFTDEQNQASASEHVVQTLSDLLGDVSFVDPGFFHAKLRERQVISGAEPDDQPEHQAHIFDGRECIFCAVTSLDDEIHGPIECIKRDQYVYTTETPTIRKDRS